MNIVTRQPLTTTCDEGVEDLQNATKIYKTFFVESHLLQQSLFEVFPKFAILCWMSLLLLLRLYRNTNSQNFTILTKSGIFERVHVFIIILITICSKREDVSHT